jgi:hypothetical protein
MKSFADLCQREPRLRSLERDIQAVTDTGGPWFCASDCGIFRAALSLVYCAWHGE